MNELPSATSAEVTAIPAAVTHPRSFSVLECVFAWLCFAAGYVFWRVCPVSIHPLGGLLFVILLFITTAVVLKRKGATFRILPLLVACSALIISLALIFCSNAFLHVFAYLYALSVYCYFLYAAGDNVTEEGFSNLIVIDFIKALFILPFCSFRQLFRAMFSGKAKNGGRLLLKLLIGIAITLIPTTAVLSLLSYDNRFTELLHSIFSFNLADLCSHMVSLTLAVPSGMYLFGLYISSADQACSHIMTADACRTVSSEIKALPAATALAAALPLLFLYVIFFLSQWQYYISGFTRHLPYELSYAAYAREGFFQLCTVSVINLIMITAIMLFMRRRADRPPVLLKTLSILYAVFTLVLISTAVAKMVMYIHYYGLTQKRVYATWMMAVLAVIFLLIILHQFLPKLHTVAASLLAAVLLFAVLSLSNVDGIIARYNVDRYIQGDFKTVDIEAIEALGDAGIPELVRLSEAMEQKLRSGAGTSEDNAFYDDLMKKLNTKAALVYDKERSVFSLTLPYLKAKKAISSIS